MFHKRLSFKPHQSAGGEILHKLDRAGLTFPTGQGKCLTSLLSYHLRKMKDITRYKRAVVFVPTNAVTAWEEASTFLDAHMTFFPGNVYGFEVVVCTHSRIHQLVEATNQQFFEESIVIVDEVDCFSNPLTSMYEALAKVSRWASVLWGLTATVLHNDLRSTYWFIDVMFKGHRNPFGTFENFCRTFITFRERTIRRGRTVQEISGYKNLDLLQKVLKSFLVMSTSNVDIQFSFHYTDFTQEELKRYSLHARDALKSNAAAAGIAELQKITDGTHVGDELSSKEKVFDEKVAELAARGNPFIVYIEYHDVRKMLVPIIKKHGVTVHEIYGAISPRERGIVADKTRAGGKQCIIMTKAGIRGANLQFCESTLIYDCPTNIRDLVQLLGRQARIGSPYKKWYAPFIGVRGTIDEYKLMYVMANSEMALSLLRGHLVLPENDRTVTRQDIIDMRKALIWKTQSRRQGQGLAV